MLKNKFNILSVLTLTVFACIINEIYGHGMMLDPVSRSSRWRYNKSAPINYDDNGLFCGGFGVQWFQNNGKCGLCGDDFAARTPRENELGGKYGQGIITKAYIQSQKARLGIKITTNHLGFFYFNICNLDKFKVESEACFNANKIKFSDGSFKMYIGKKSGMIYPTIVLPRSLNCKHCVLRWNYQAGNNWGPCGNGTSAVGCGPQENFKGCSDISITMKSQKNKSYSKEKYYKRIPIRKVNFDYDDFVPADDLHSNLPLDNYLYESPKNNDFEDIGFELKNEDKKIPVWDKKLKIDINNYLDESEEEGEEETVNVLVNNQFSKEEDQDEDEEKEEEEEKEQKQEEKEEEVKVLDKGVIEKPDSILFDTNEMYKTVSDLSKMDQYFQKMYKSYLNFMDVLYKIDNEEILSNSIDDSFDEEDYK